MIDIGRNKFNLKGVYNKDELTGLDKWNLINKTGVDSKGRQFQVYTRTVSHTFGWKFAQGLKAFLATIFTLGFAMIAKNLRNLWQQSIDGKEQKTIKVLTAQANVIAPIAQNAIAPQENPKKEYLDQQVAMLADLKKNILFNFKQLIIHKQWEFKGYTAAKCFITFECENGRLAKDFFLTILENQLGTDEDLAKAFQPLEQLLSENLGKPKKFAFLMVFKDMQARYFLQNGYETTTGAGSGLGAFHPGSFERDLNQIGFPKPPSLKENEQFDPVDQDFDILR